MKGDSVSMMRTESVILNPLPKEKATGNLHSHVVPSSSPMVRALEIQANLPPHFPSFLKVLVRTCVSGRFWLSIPRKFYDDHLPKQDDHPIVVVDENEQGYDVKLWRHKTGKTGVSAGWRRFSIAHKLLEGDVLVFQLIEPCKFKVYIVRDRRLTEVDGAKSLPNPDVRAEPSKAVKMEDLQEEEADFTELTRDKYLEPLAENSNRKKYKESLFPCSKPDLDRPGEDRYNFGRGNFKGFEDFSIRIDGLILDPEIPLHLRMKYSELCRCQNVSLHENLIRGLNSKLAAITISETVNIADAIRAVNPSTHPDNLESWDKTLKAFEDLGMVVGFLRARIQKLLSLSRETHAIIELRRIERAEAEEEMRALNTKLSNVRTRIQKIDSSIYALNMKNEGVASVFQDIACAPW